MIRIIGFKKFDLTSRIYNRHHQIFISCHNHFIVIFVSSLHLFGTKDAMGRQLRFYSRIELRPRAELCRSRMGRGPPFNFASLSRKQCILGLARAYTREMASSFLCNSLFIKRCPLELFVLKLRRRLWRLDDLLQPIVGSWNLPFDQVAPTACSQKSRVGQHRSIQVAQPKCTCFFFPLNKLNRVYYIAFLEMIDFPNILLMLVYLQRKSIFPCAQNNFSWEERIKRSKERAKTEFSPLPAASRRASQWAKHVLDGHQ